MRIGLLGTGRWARDVHGPGLAASPDVDLVGVWGRDVAKAEALAGKLGVPAFADRATLLADVDAVSIALAPDAQSAAALEAARAGKHLLLEKPLALDLAEGDELVRVITDKGLATVVFVTGRFQPAAEAVLDRAVEIGGWSGGRADIRVSVLSEDDAVLQASTWRVERGALWDAAPHALSPLVTVLGTVEQVVALEDASRATFLTLRHESGVCSQISTTLQAPPAAFAWSVEVYGSDGRLDIPHDLNGADRYFQRAVRELAERVGSGQPSHRVDVHFARHLLAVVVAAQRSIETGRVEQVTAAP
ncbi:MAG: Gfo/Idh/MocA family oxidoreductase [Nakamurella sp.]